MQNQIWVSLPVTDLFYQAVPLVSEVGSLTALELQEQLVSTELLDHKVPLELLGHKVPLVSTELLDHKVPLVSQGRKVPLVQVLLVPLGHKVTDIQLHLQLA
jgi:hypothetical protein